APAESQGPTVRATVRGTAPEHDRGAHCWGPDEPSGQPPRGIDVAGPYVPGAVPAEPGDAHPVGAPIASHPSRTTHGASSAGRIRARIGVWRT
ncbi:hypothetical protein AB4212_31705, partial [Streptomyces sp. 2MCAF27]